MKSISMVDLDNRLKEHQLRLDSQGLEGSALSLVGFDLEGFDLYRSNLSGSKLAKSNLTSSNLSGANLRQCELYDSDLTDSDLTGANLSFCFLFRSNLAGANLRQCELYNSDLTGANLTGADLSGCSLWETIGNDREIKTVKDFRYHINYTAEVLQIGCERHTIDEWYNFSDDTIHEMHEVFALDFWKENKDKIFDILERDPATPTGHENKVFDTEAILKLRSKLSNYLKNVKIIDLRVDPIFEDFIMAEVVISYDYEHPLVGGSIPCVGEYIISAENSDRRLNTIVADNTLVSLRDVNITSFIEETDESIKELLVSKIRDLADYHEIGSLEKGGRYVLKHDGSRAYWLNNL